MATAAKTRRTDPAPALRFDDHEFVADLQAAVLDIWPDTTQAQIDAVAAQLRHRWQGERPPYLPKTSDAARRRRDDLIRREHRAGERVPYLARRHQLSERQIIRIVQADPAA